MIRTPLRPLARILRARSRGENPDLIEKDNLRQRHQIIRDKVRGQARMRVLLLIFVFILSFGSVAFKMGVLAMTVPVEPKLARTTSEIEGSRSEIVDRHGRLLATNLATHALYAQTKDLVDPERAALELARIFPDLNPEQLLRRFTDNRSFLWIKKVISPEQMQAVHDLGEPGLLFAPRDMRLYPNGTLAAHILGGATFGDEGVDSAGLVGMAGIEKAMEKRLSDPAMASQPLELSLDLTVQAAIEELLETGVKMYNAKGGAAILMDVRTGEIIAMASNPVFDPNNRPLPLVGNDVEASDSPLFNRAVQGVYELGSTFKIFTAAQALELGLINLNTPINTQSLTVGKKTFTEFDNKNYGPTKTISEVMAVSSNIGTGHVALMIGGERQRAFLTSLGLLAPSPVELVEAPGAKPLVPKKWSELVTVTASFGHGMSSSVLNLAAAYATVANGGIKVTPTLLRRTAPMEGVRVMSKSTAAASVGMLREVVVTGTASAARIDEYAIGGKTGTADKPRKSGGYYEDKVINTFAATFPTENPQYVILVSLDEPVDLTGDEVRRTAGWTAVPVAAEMVRRVGPLLRLRPAVAAGAEVGVTQAKQ